MNNNINNIMDNNISIPPDSIILTSNIRDEDNIPEWIAYHTLIGFDYILICDHKSKVPIVETLSKYDFNNVFVIMEERENVMKYLMMNRLLEIAKNIRRDG